MKIRSLMVSAAMLASTAATIATPMVSQAAATYNDATHTQVPATIKFAGDDDHGIVVNPDDPSKPVHPDVTNPNHASLMIQYASDLNFGESDGSTLSFQALADKVKGADDEDVFVTPFVAVKDTIKSDSTDDKGWTLSAKQDGKFTSTEDNGGELDGAFVKLSNIKDNTAENGATGHDVTLSGDSQVIATAAKGKGRGNTSIAFGTVGKDATAESRTNGVTLDIPASTGFDNATYSTTVTYELVAGVK